jgi:hypothetical protein
VTVDSGIFVGNLPTALNAAPTDAALVLRNPGQTNATLRLVSWGTLGANLALACATPANSTAAGYPGQACFDGSYLYVCIANNQWGRAALVSTGW